MTTAPTWGPIASDTEAWLPVPGWEGLYEVSNQGQVKAVPRLVESYGGRAGVRRERILKAHPEPTGGHLRVTLKGRGRKENIGVHRLVLMAFVGPSPEGMEGCHNDGDPANNHLPNLRWDTRKANVQDTLTHGRNYWARQVACSKGHPFTGENLLVTAGRRRCRTCLRVRAREARARRKEAVA